MKRRRLGRSGLVVSEIGNETAYGLTTGLWTSDRHGLARYQWDDVGVWRAAAGRVQASGLGWRARQAA